MSSGKVIRLRRLSWSEVLLCGYFGVILGWSLGDVLHRHEINRLKREVA